MKTQIENEQEFADAIDQYGETLATIETRQAEAKMLKQMLEAYANANRITRHSTGRYTLRMKRGEETMRRAYGVSEADIVAELKNSENGKAYLVTTYDANALKRDYATNEQGRDVLAGYGFVLTDPQRHAEVKRSGSR